MGYTRVQMELYVRVDPRNALAPPSLCWNSDVPGFHIVSLVTWFCRNIVYVTTTDVWIFKHDIQRRPRIIVAARVYRPN